jgi:acyl carrier protein
MIATTTQDAAESAEATHDSKLETIRNWLLEVNPEAKNIDLDTDLFEGGLLSSIQLVELVLLVEELSGHEVTADDNAADRFRTLRAITSSYLACVT